MVPPFDVEEFAHESESKIRGARTPPPKDELTLDRIRALFVAGEYEDALALAETVLCAVPLHAEARAVVSDCHTALEQVYTATIGSLASVPTLAVPARELRTFALDHAAGFIASQIDGVTNVETLLDICGMPRVAALRILSDLTVRGIITLR